MSQVIQSGPRGPQGVQGVQGIQGIQGETGPQGPSYPTRTKANIAAARDGVADGEFFIVGKATYQRDDTAVGAASIAADLGEDGVVSASEDLAQFPASPAIVRGVDTGAEVTGAYFGMNGNTTQNTAALEDAAAYFAGAKGGKLIVPEGNFSFDRPIIWPANMQIELNPKTVLEFGAGLDNTAFTWSGAAGTPVAVTVDANKHDTSITVAAGDQAEFVANGFARILSTAIFDPARTGTKIAEIVRVRSVANGVINLWEPLRDTYAIAGETVTVTPITMAGKCGITGGALIGTIEAASNELFGLNFKFCEAPIVSHIGLGRLDQRATWFEDCDRPHLHHAKFFDLVGDTTAYAISFANATRGGIAEHVQATNVRHLSSTNNAGDLGGVVRDSTFRDIWGSFTSTALGGSMGPGDMFDTHAAADGLLFERCVSKFAQGIAFNIECINAEVRDCEAILPQKTAVNGTNWTGRNGNFTVRNLHVEQSAEEVIKLSGGNAANGATPEAYGKIIIDGVLATAAPGNTDIAVILTNNGGKRSKLVRTHDCELYNFGGAAAVHIDGADRWEFGKNRGSGNAGRYLRARDATIIEGDLGTAELAPGEEYLYIDANTSDALITGGKPTQAAGAVSTGIRAQAGVGNVTLRSVDLSGMGAKVNIPATVPFDTDDKAELRSDAISIAGGVLSGIRSHHRLVILDTEAAAASDDLWQIDTSQMTEGQTVSLRLATSSRQVTAKDATSAASEGVPNLRLGGGADKPLNSSSDLLTLMHINGTLQQLGYSDN